MCVILTLVLSHQDKRIEERQRLRFRCVWYHQTITPSFLSAINVLPEKLFETFFLAEVFLANFRSM